MFPSGDPFAYPNQPMTTIENDDFLDDMTGVANANQAPPDPFALQQSAQQQPSCSTDPSAGLYAFDNGIEVQLFGPLQPYLVQGQQPGLGVDMAAFQGAVPTAGTGTGATSGNDGDLMGTQDWATGQATDFEDWKAWGTGEFGV